MFEFKVKTRDLESASAGKLRQDELIPGEIYGHKKKNQHVTVVKNDFEKLYNKVGESNLIELTIDENKPINVLVKNIQQDPVTDEVIHIDFYIVNMNEKLSTEIPLEFIGISKAVKELGGVFVKSISDIQVSCLPKDLVPKIDVDISALEEFDQVITIGDLKIPEGITLNLNDSIPVCLVQPPRVEKEPVKEEDENADEGDKKEEDENADEGDKKEEDKKEGDKKEKSENKK